MKNILKLKKVSVLGIEKIWKKFVKAVQDFELIEDGDRIAVGVSGGKDSLLLCKLFQELKRIEVRILNYNLFL